VLHYVGAGGAKKEPTGLLSCRPDAQISSKNRSISKKFPLGTRDIMHRLKMLYLQSNSRYKYHQQRLCAALHLIYRLWLIIFQGRLEVSWLAVDLDQFEGCWH